MSSFLKIGSALDQLVDGATGAIGALAYDENETVFALTADRALRGSKGYVSGPELIGKVAIEPERISKNTNAIGINLLHVADPRLLLGERIQGIRQGNLKRLGGVRALRSAVKLLDSCAGTENIHRNLIEVLFEEFGRDISGKPTTERMPALDPTDAGSLVINSRNEPIGLTVAGSGYVCFVVPLRPYLKRQSLTFGVPPNFKAFPETSESELEILGKLDQLRALPGLNALVDELAHELD